MTFMKVFSFRMTSKRTTTMAPLDFYRLSCSPCLSPVSAAAAGARMAAQAPQLATTTISESRRPRAYK